MRNAPKRQYKLVCANCNTEFFGVQQRHLYCSSECGHKQAYKNNMLNYKWRIAKLCSMAKNRAKEKQLPFDLTTDFLISLWDEQCGCCVLTGVPFNLEPSSEYVVHPDAPSIDRIKPELGYVMSNVRFVKYHVNVALSEYGHDELLKLAKQLSGVAYR